MGARWNVSGNFSTTTLSVQYPILNFKNQLSVVCRGDDCEAHGTVLHRDGVPQARSLSPTMSILIKVSDINVSISKEDVAALLHHLEFASARLSSWSPSDSPQMPPNPPGGVSIFVETGNVEALLFGHSMPRVRLAAVDIYGACDFSTDQMCIGILGVELSGIGLNHEWVG